MFPKITNITNTQKFDGLKKCFSFIRKKYFELIARNAERKYSISVSVRKKKAIPNPALTPAKGNRGFQKRTYQNNTSNSVVERKMIKNFV